MTPTLLAIDQGTTSTRAILFGAAGEPLHAEQRELRQIYPQDGWVEHDPEEIWQATLTVCRAVLAKADAPPAAIGITNQRETTVLWDRATGRAVYNAIVWQDRRGADHCARLAADGHGGAIQERTGLVVDSYFSATKLAWLLDNVEGARAAAERGDLAFGTIDSFLLWRLTGGKVHATDATNAARTMLFNIHTQSWDDTLLDLFDVPAAVLPEVRDCATDFGETGPELSGASIPIGGMAGDQHAAMIGQSCFAPGMVKATFGTGCFVLAHTGSTPGVSKNRLLTTVAYRLNGETAYALEGSVFNSGTAVQWLRDGLGIIENAAETEVLAAGLSGNHGVYFVPAFTGLGAPHWRPGARGAIHGLTRDAGRAEIVRAALEAACYQAADLLAAMTADGATPPIALRADGGMAANGWLMQFLADVLDVPVERPLSTETTALGAALLAGLQCGVYRSLDDLSKTWQLDRRFEPRMKNAERKGLLDGWAAALARVVD
ncbi:MAG: glycerol kinase GlpK [Proteobacteria bacterium]|nr:glycerol kinase GlpK [Pseudomonadota bacterium]